MTTTETRPLQIEESSNNFLQLADLAIGAAVEVHQDSYEPSRITPSGLILAHMGATTHYQAEITDIVDPHVHLRELGAKPNEPTRILQLGLNTIHDFKTVIRGEFPVRQDPPKLLTISRLFLLD